MRDFRHISVYGVGDLSGIRVFGDASATDEFNPTLFLFYKHRFGVGWYSADATMLKHKTFFLIGLLSLVAVFLISCDESPDSGSSADVPAQFTCSSSSNESTRAYDETWEITDRVGIYMVPSNSNHDLTKALKVNHPYKPSVSGESVTLNPVDETIFYPVNGSTVNFVAYSPYLSTATTANQATYTFTGQDTKATKEAVDFIFYRGENERSKTNATESMIFTHKFCKINITVTQGANGPSCEGLTMQLTNVPLSATVNLAALASDETNTTALGISAANTTIEAYTSSSSSTYAVVEAIVAPHSGTGNFTERTFTFSAGGYTYTLPNGTTFEPGKVYTFDFTLTQTAPILSGTKITDWTGGTIAWDGDYALTAPTLVNHYKEASVRNRVVITTTHTATPGIEYSTSATEITGTATVAKYLTQTAFTKTKITSPYEWTLMYNLSENSEATNREGYIHVTVETMKVVVKVAQSTLSKSGVLLNGDVNCFMVATGATIHFPVTRAMEYGEASSDDTFTAIKLWDDTSGGAVVDYSVSGTGTDAVISVTAGTAAGNAVIALYKTTDTANAVWSWHIWVTDYNPYQGTTFTNTLNENNNGSNFVFMDRNLGATFAGTGSGVGTGLFYQWGRKDPFPATLDPGEEQPGGGTFTAVETSTTNGTVTNTIRHPDIFYTAVSMSSQHDWHYSNRDNTLWGHGNTVPKSVYDPCPVGWRVPSHNVTASEPANAIASPWSGFSTSNAGTFSLGYFWGETAQYPAAGYRTNLSGAELLLVGTQGYYWSASPSNVDPRGSSMYFGHDFVDVNGSSLRAYGFSVRCVQVSL